jgi:hypothetical protein
MNPTGVAFPALSSGYVWVTNEYGFFSFDIVLCNGTFTQVTVSSDAELFSALQVPF